MKIMAIYETSETEDKRLAMLVWPDSAIVRSGKPVFTPEFESGCAVVIGLGIKIDRLGKSITKDFSSRYYNEAAPIALVLSKRNLDAIRRKATDIQPDYVADYSVVCGNFIATQRLDGPVNVSMEVTSLSGDACMQAGWDCGDIAEEMSEIIVFASRRNTLKTGDIVVKIIPDLGFDALRNGRLDVSVDGKSLLNIKMK